MSVLFLEKRPAAETRDSSQRHLQDRDKTTPQEKGKETPVLNREDSPPQKPGFTMPRPCKEAVRVAPLHMKLYFDVRNSGVPNHMAVKRRVPSDLNCDAWDKYLAGYHDQEITQFLRYGWPIAYVACQPPRPTLVNHASALRNPTAINAFITKELKMHALLGPFSALPFTEWTQVSPLMTRDKPDGSGKRVIIDLSFPDSNSVNDGIVKTDSPSYTLPTPLDLADLMSQAGRGAFMWKSDLSRAYRQLRIDPLDYPLLCQT